MLASLLSIYLSINITFFIGALICAVFLKLSLHYRVLSFKQNLNLNYFLFSVCLLLPVVQSVFTSKGPVFEPIAKVWTAPPSENFLILNNPHQILEKTSISVGGSSFHYFHFESLLLLLSILFFIYGIYITLRDLRALKQILNASFVHKKIRRVKIYLNDEIQIPFSFWLPGIKGVVLPSSVFEKREDFRVALSHELQHHRQHDTIWVYFLQISKILMLWNLAIHFWIKLSSQLQEFACDETLVDQRKVSSCAYIDCLVRVAETVSLRKNKFAGATNLFFLEDRKTLKRRIQNMLSLHPHKKNRSIFVASLIIGTISIASISWASQHLVQDRRVTMKEAEAMAKNAGPTEFPIVVNDLVLKQLNQYLGTEKGRRHMKESLKRMEDHRAMIEKKLKEYDVPSELIAIPIIESGYKNSSQTNKYHSAGLWMFIPQTAKAYGLKVGENDERLNPELETDAAMRLLMANKLRFQDWGLSVLAYNAGEKTIQKGIDKNKTRDPWALVQAGVELDANYLSNLTAAILIMKNPDSLN